MKTRVSTISLLVFLSIVLMLVVCQTLSHGAAITFDNYRINNAVVHVITADLNNPCVKVDVGLPEKGIPHSEPFLRMVQRHKPVAAVTGTYFDTRTLYPVGSIVIKGQLAYDAAMGTAVCFLRPAGVCSVQFIKTREGEPFGWKGVETGLRTGPLLLHKGMYALDPRREGFKQRSLFQARTRMALGVTADNRLLLAAVATPVTFERLAGVMKALGATDAVALDGGTSSAMYYRGQTVRSPGRALTNVIEVYETDPSPAAQAIKPQPSPLRATTRIYRANMAPCAASLAATPLMCRRLALSLSLPNSTAGESAILPAPPSLRTAKGRHSGFPIDRAKLAGLQRLNHSKDLVHVASDVQIMHHLVS